MAFVTALLVALSPAAAGRDRPVAGRDCEALAGLKMRHAEIIAAEAVASGVFTAPDGGIYDVPAFCRVRGEARPTAGSRIGFEVWMPAGGWTGRYYQLGNGGFGGSIPYPSLAAELRRGNAVAATDTGHRGSGFDATWARGRPESIVDYGHRSLKETADASARLLRAYYGAPARHRYYTGCSNGGRQALVAAQRYPDDWDGVLAGAPALDWTRQLTSFAWLQATLREDRASRIPRAKLPAIQRAALASCAAAARVVRDVPADPRFCRLDPAALICEGEETSDCLTREQAEALDVIQEGPREPATGERFFFGFEATSAALEGGWERWIVGDEPGVPTQLTFAEQFFRNVVHGDPQWNVAAFEAAHDPVLARETKVQGEPLTRVLDATSADLRRLERRGGRILMYFGWADALISPRAGVDYYRRVVERTGGLERTRAFFRLFMVPGMLHCQGGPGPHAFGQAHVAPALHDDPVHDIRRALEAWVERGVAPERLVAAKYVNDDPAQGVEATRVLCPFPAIAADPPGGGHGPASSCIEGTLL